MPSVGDASGAPLTAVIDTNIWLDLLVFDDPGTRRLAALLAPTTGALTTGTPTTGALTAMAPSGGAHAAASSRAGVLRPLATAPMRAELADVLGRPQFALAPARQLELLTRFDDWVVMSPDAPDCRVACRDPDDRKFLDLAVMRGVTWLLSRDRALLAARKTAARRFALRIGTPNDFDRWLDQVQP